MAFPTDHGLIVMNILHLASFDRWTGASAPALAEVEALRKYGTEAHFAYVGGLQMEERLQGRTFAHPVIKKKQNPLTFRRSVAALLELVEGKGIDIVHAHLSYDHALAVQMRRKLGSLRVVRTFHSRRTLRRDPFTRLLLSHTARVCVVNETFVEHPAMARRRPLFTPPPVDTELFRPSGPDARAALGLKNHGLVLGIIGKVAPQRGFEEAIETYAMVARSQPESHLVIIGQGHHRPALERLIHERGIESRVIWAGYHEADLPDYLRVLDVMLIARTGSDEGHRAVLEALACGVPAACYPIPGLRSLTGTLTGRLVAREPTPDALAETALELLSSAGPSLSAACVDAVSLARYEPTARRLRALYAEASQ